jgi:hypothetical protein
MTSIKKISFKKLDYRVKPVDVRKMISMVHSACVNFQELCLPVTSCFNEDQIQEFEEQGRESFSPEFKVTFSN